MRCSGTALRALPARQGRVFGYTSAAGVRQGLRRACKRAEVAYLGTHQPGRHSFATTLDAAGMSPKATAEAGGWKTVRISQGYVHPHEAAKRAAEIMTRGTKLPQITEGVPQAVEKKRPCARHGPSLGRKRP